MGWMMVVLCMLAKCVMYSVMTKMSEHSRLLYNVQVTTVLCPMAGMTRVKVNGGHRSITILIYK